MVSIAQCKRGGRKGAEPRRGCFLFSSLRISAPPRTRRLLKMNKFLLLCFATLSLSAEDWPQFRGPNHDGISREKNWLADWLAGLTDWLLDW